MYAKIIMWIGKIRIICFFKKRLVDRFALKDISWQIQGIMFFNKPHVDPGSKRIPKFGACFIYFAKVAIQHVNVLM